MSKNKAKKKLMKIFGKKFNGYDILFLIIILGFPIYLLIKSGLTAFIENFASQIWSGVVIGYIVFSLLKKTKK